MELKEEIYGEVNRLRFDSKKSVDEIKIRLEKTFGKEVPIELIKEIIKEIHDTRKGILTNNVLLEEAKMSLHKTKVLEKKDGGLKSLVEAVGDTDKYLYNEETDHYIFYDKNGKPYPVPRTTIKAIFESFAKRGKNLSSDEIISEFGLSPDAWVMIKNATNLYKTSLPDDPMTIKLLEGKDVEGYVKEKTERLRDSAMRKIYDKALDGKKEADLRKLALSNKGYELFMDKLERVIKLYEPRDFNNIEIPEIHNNKTKDVFFTDTHLGKVGTDGIVVRIKKLTRDLVECEERNINITFGGDLAECLVPYGEMHPGQRMGMENINTEDLIMLVVDVFEQMLLALYKAGKKVTFNGMSGNHDRFTEKKEFDPYRTPSVVIYRFLQRIVENTNININILRNKIEVIKSGKTKYVYLHGDGVGLAQIQRLALEHKETDYYTVIISGDKHHLAMKTLSDTVMWIQSPAMAGAGKYDEGLTLSSNPGAIFFSKNADGIVEPTIKTYL